MNIKRIPRKHKPTIQGTAFLATVLISSGVHANDFGETLQPLPGPRIIEEIVDLEHNIQSTCVLKENGQAFCWNNTLSGTDNMTVAPNEAGYKTLNTALNNDIEEISLSNMQLCGIGKTSGVACVYFGDAQPDVNPRLDNPPEPDAAYIAMTSISQSDSSICAIQNDNRTVCWGSHDGINQIPPEAQYLKQVDTFADLACGIDLTDNVACWGAGTSSQQLDDINPASFGKAKQISLGESSVCIIDSNEKLICLGEMSEYTDAFSYRSFSSIDIQARAHNKPLLCYQYINGSRGCRYTSLYMGSIGNGSAIPNFGELKLISWAEKSCVITTENKMICVPSFYTPINQFPTAPENLQIFRNATQYIEIIWDKASELNTDDDYATGYEIYRNDVLLGTTGLVSKYFVENISGAVNIEVRPVRGAIAGYSSFVSDSGHLTDWDNDQDGAQSDDTPDTEFDSSQEEARQEQASNGTGGAGASLALPLIMLMVRRRKLSTV